jgi:putative flippase GtrA
MDEKKAAPVKLTFKENVLQTVKYFCFAASAGVVQYGSYTLLTQFTPLPHWLRYLISLVLSVVCNFTFNRKFTFKSASNVPIAMLMVLGYYVVFTPISTYANRQITVAHPEVWVGYVCEAVTMLINGVTEFLYYRFVVFNGGTEFLQRRFAQFGNFVKSKFTNQAPKNEE